MPPRPGTVAPPKLDMSIFDDVYINFLHPPFVGAQGKWVLTKHCTQKKSFGHFKCSNGHKWTSAHAFNPKVEKVCKQACQVCKEMRSAWCMWQNSRTGDSSKKSTDNDTDKPHQKANCERCRKGLMCT